MAENDENRDPGSQTVNTGSEEDFGNPRRLEYEIQAYGFSFKALSDSLYNVMGNYMAELITEFERRMVAEGKTENGRLKEQVARFKTNMEKVISRVCDQAESVMASEYSIPDHVVLPSDEVQLHALSPQDRATLQEQNAKLELLFAKRCYERRMLELAVADLRRIREEQKAALDSSVSTTL